LATGGEGEADKDISIAERGVRSAGEIHIRPALAEDIRQLCDLLADLFSLESDFAPCREKQEKGLRLLLDNNGASSIVLVAEQEGQVLGMCSVQKIISTAEGGPAGIVEDVVVHREHRGQGIGGSLLGAAMAWCTKQGISRMQLLADRHNAPALQFYFSREWTVTGLICLRKHF
jgi:GNAT superfamily N-acetyltransferase